MAALSRRQHHSLDTAVDARLEGESPASKGDCWRQRLRALMQQSSLVNRNYERSIVMQLTECEGQALRREDIGGIQRCQGSISYHGPLKKRIRSRCEL